MEQVFGVVVRVAKGDYLDDTYVKSGTEFSMFRTKSCTHRKCKCPVLVILQGEVAGKRTTSRTKTVTIQCAELEFGDLIVDLNLQLWLAPPYRDTELSSDGNGGIFKSTGHRVSCRALGEYQTTEYNLKQLLCPGTNALDPQPQSLGPLEAGELKDDLNPLTFTRSLGLVRRKCELNKIHIYR